MKRYASPTNCISMKTKWEAVVNQRGIHFKNYSKKNQETWAIWCTHRMKLISKLLKSKIVDEIRVPTEVMILALNLLTIVTAEEKRNDARSETNLVKEYWWLFWWRVLRDRLMKSDELKPPVYHVKVNDPSGLLLSIYHPGDDISRLALKLIKGIDCNSNVLKAYQFGNRQYCLACSTDEKKKQRKENNDLSSKLQITSQEKARLPTMQLLLHCFRHTSLWWKYTSLVNMKSSK